MRGVLLTPGRPGAEDALVMLRRVLRNVHVMPAPPADEQAAIRTPSTTRASRLSAPARRARHALAAVFAMLAIETVGHEGRSALSRFNPST